MPSCHVNAKPQHPSFGSNPSVKAKSAPGGRSLSQLGGRKHWTMLFGSELSISRVIPVRAVICDRDKPFSSQDQSLTR